MLQTIKTNDLKKGDKLFLKNGWEAILEDNKKGNIRLAKVFGYYEEIGSVYMHDVKRAIKDGQIFAIELTPQQKKVKGLCF